MPGLWNVLFGTTRPARPAKRSATRLGLESLEDRTVPAASAVFQNGVLTVTGDSAGDRIEVRDLRMPSGNLDRWISLGGGSTRVFVNGVQISITVLFTNGGQTFSSLRHDLYSPSHFNVWAGGGNDTVIVSTDLTSNFITTRIDGGDGDDYLQASYTRDTITGGNGHDTVYSGEGNDWVDGGSGDDFLQGGTGNDTLLGSAGWDQLIGADGNDHPDGGDHTDRMWGGIGDDYLFGGIGWWYDHLDAEAGNDWVDGGDGDDYLFGLSGNDTLNGGNGHDHLFGGTENDTLNGGWGGDYLYGEDGNDSLDGNEEGDQLYGGNGDDSLFGGAGWVYDYLDGGPGTDRLNGGDGDDTLLGNAGWDTLDGGEGNDTLYGDWTTPIADGAPDVIHGGNGIDIIHGGESDDRLYGHGGNDRIYGEGGNDLIYGGEGHDELHGREGNDRLFGDGGADVLFGGVDADYLDGGLGFDKLDAGGQTGDRELPGDAITYTPSPIPTMPQLASNFVPYTGSLQFVRVTQTGRAGTSALAATDNFLDFNALWNSARFDIEQDIDYQLTREWPEKGGLGMDFAAVFLDRTPDSVHLSNAANDGTVTVRMSFTDNNIWVMKEGIDADLYFSTSVSLTVGLVNGEFSVTAVAASVSNVRVDGHYFIGDFLQGLYDFANTVSGDDVKKTLTEKINDGIVDSLPEIRESLNKDLAKRTAEIPAELRPLMAQADMTFDTATGRITLIL